MALLTSSEKASVVIGGDRGNSRIRFEMASLNGNAELAGQNASAVEPVVFGALALRCNGDKAALFFARKMDRASVLLVPSALASDRSPHFGRSLATVVMDFGGNRLRLEASRQGEDTTSITFARLDSSGGSVWIPEQAGLKLVDSAEYIGAVATEITEMMAVPDADFSPQVHLTTQSNLV